MHPITRIHIFPKKGFHKTFDLSLVYTKPSSKYTFPFDSACSLHINHGIKIIHFTNSCVCIT